MPICSCSGGAADLHRYSVAVISVYSDRRHLFVSVRDAVQKQGRLRRRLTYSAGAAHRRPPARCASVYSHSGKPLSADRIHCTSRPATSPCLLVR